MIIYAGSLVNPQLLEYAREDCKIFNSAKMTLEEVLEVIFQAEEEGKLRSVSIQEIPVFTELSGNRWMCWMRKGSLMITARE